MKILVTGAAGLLGSRLIEWVLDNRPDVSICAVDDLSGGFIENLPKSSRCTILIMDCMDSLFEEAVLENFGVPDFVFHFAAYAAEGLSPFIRKYNYINNVVATANVINFCIKNDIKRLVFTSSMAVYGNGTPPFDEILSRNPIDPYGIAKSACEQDIEVAGEQHNLDWCIIRPHNCYGRNQNIWDSYRNFIGIAMYKGLINDAITIYGDGSQTRAFSDMSDIVQPLWNAAVEPRASKQIINLGGIEESSILDVATIISKLSGAPIIHLPARHEVKHAHSTWDKSVNILGFQHVTSLQEGIENMWEWAQKQPKRDRFVWDSYEIDKGLYPYWKPDALRDGYWTTNKEELQ